MTELEKDLENALGDPWCSSVDNGDTDIVEFLAARLAELGYVKVVRCGECKLQHSPYCYHEGFDDKDYCSEGERVVASEEAGK